MSYDLDLGDEHFLTFTSWNPDLGLNPQWAHLAHLIRTTPHFGCIIRHKANTETGLHEGCLTFDTELAHASGSLGPFWKIDLWEPLTISPSVLCSCGDHGFIRDGKWVKA